MVGPGRATKADSTTDEVKYKYYCKYYNSYILSVTLKVKGADLFLYCL